MSDDVSEELKQDYREYLQSIAPRRQRDDEFTLQDALREMKCSRDAARTVLAIRVKAGELEETKGVILKSGTIGSVWRVMESRKK